MANLEAEHRNNVFCLICKDKSNLLSSVTQAVEECIKEDVLADFFREHKSEVIEMGIFEYNAEEHEQVLKDESYFDGIERGITKGKVEIMYTRLLMTPNEIAEDMKLSVEEVQAIIDTLDTENKRD